MSRPPLAGSLLVANASGPHAHKVNGVFEPTTEMCDGLPVFQNKGNGDLWLQFFRLEWSVVSTDYRGTSKSYAFISTGAAGMCLPQDCPRGEWQVWMGGEGKQRDPAVTVTVLSDLPNNTLALVEEAILLYNEKVN